MWQTPDDREFESLPVQSDLLLCPPTVVQCTVGTVIKDLNEYAMLSLSQGFIENYISGPIDLSY